jgi:hypothetical protein
VLQDVAEIDQDYQHDVVRDLAWAIASPPLMLSDNAVCEWFDYDWYQQRYRDSSAWLRSLDRDPAALQEAVAAQKDRRLGNYFETLWAFWLETDPRYDLIVRNLPVRDNGSTLGELDFIVQDNQSGLNYHWEVAVKFYLGVADTNRLENWHGPSKRDRLDLKLTHLRERQSQICRLPQTQTLLREKGIDIAGCAVILKGRLFYPHDQLKPRYPQGACDSHLRSHWFRLAEFRTLIHADDRFRPLLSSGWMSDHGAADDPTGSYRWQDMEIAIQQGEYRLPLYLVRICRDQYTRLFLVPDDWDQGL